jgi:hypothetical protein
MTENQRRGRFLPQNLDTSKFLEYVILPVAVAVIGGWND